MLKVIASQQTMGKKMVDHILKPFFTYVRHQSREVPMRRQWSNTGYETTPRDTGARQTQTPTRSQLQTGDAVTDSRHRAGAWLLVLGARFLAHAFFCNLESLYWKGRERQREGERTVCHFRRGAGKKKLF